MARSDAGEIIDVREHEPGSGRFDTPAGSGSSELGEASGPDHPEHPDQEGERTLRDLFWGKG
jgi:hypothetical protein